MKKFLRFSIVTIIIPSIICSNFNRVAAQNLVPNPSFEISGSGMPSFPPWQNAGNGSADHYVVPSSAPSNFIGFQYANTGNAYVGAFIGRTGGATAENFTTQLLTPMVSGHQYLVSMYVSLADKSRYAIDRIGVLFTPNMATAPGGTSPHITATPSLINADFNFLNDTAAWTKLQWIYTAAGNEQWINIGCFAPNGVNSYGNDTLANPNGTWNSTYYYFDDICVLDLMGPPLATTKKDTTICTFPADLTSPIIGTGYQWSTGDTSASIQITTPGTYWVKTFQECSFFIDTIVVKLGFPSQTKTVIDTFLCQGAQMVLTAPQQGQNYEWNTGNTNAIETVTQAGTYWVKYDLPNCRKHTDTFKVSYPNDPPLSLLDTIVCNQKDVYITTDTSYTSWLWSTGSTARGLFVDKDDTYWVEVKTKSDCTLKDTFTVSLVDTRQNFSDTVICSNEPVNFKLQAIGSPSAQYQWQDGSSFSYFNVTAPGTYSVRVTDNICFSENEIVVDGELCDCNVLVPNAFTPNSDGKNDYFGALFPADCQMRGYILRVFNRWGQLVFESYDVNKKWDGTFNGKPVDVGVYYYLIQFQKGTKSNKVKQKGEITLLR